jgi:hypothetical protein
MQIQHVILTRFNIPTEGAEAIRRASPGWLEGRFDLFERFCLPSVKAQIEQDFTWVMYFDIATPERFKEKVRAYTQACPNLRPYYGALADFAMPRILQSVRDFASPNDWILTSKLDCDDALARDYTKRVRGAARPGTREVLNITDGYIYNGGRIFRQLHESNAFASASEGYDDLKTIFGAWHTQLSLIAPVRQIPGPGWLQVVHGQNVSNKVRGSLVATVKARDIFALDDSVEFAKVSRLDVLRDAYIQEPLRSLRDAGVNAAKTVLGQRGTAMASTVVARMTAPRRAR